MAPLWARCRGRVLTWQPNRALFDVVLLVQYESTWGWLVLLPLYAWLLFLMFGT